MTTQPPLTRDIGQAERTLQALIRQQLAGAGVTFPEWVALTFLSGSGPLSDADLVQRLVDDEIASAGDARAVVDAMIDKRWVGPEASSPVASDRPRLTVTDVGSAVYAPLRATIGRLTGRLLADIEASDLEATRRTLHAVARRAKQLMV